MGKILLGIGVVALVVVGWLLLQPDTVDYVADVTDEVTELEAELAEIETAVANGTLTPAQAAEAQTRISTRLAAINSAADASVNASLSARERTELAAVLGRVKEVLLEYQNTLESVVEAVLELPEAQRPRLTRTPGGTRVYRGVSAIAADIIVDVNEQLDIESSATSSTEMTDDNDSTSDTSTSTEEDIMDDDDDNQSTDDTADTATSSDSMDDDESELEVDTNATTSASAQ